MVSQFPRGIAHASAHARVPAPVENPSLSLPHRCPEKALAAADVSKREGLWVFAPLLPLPLPYQPRGCKRRAQSVPRDESAGSAARRDASQERAAEPAREPAD